MREVAAVVLAAAKLLEGLGHTIAETAWPTAPTFPDDFLAFWSLGAAADMKAASEMAGKPVDETMVEPFSLRHGEQCGQAEAGGHRRRPEAPRSRPPPPMTHGSPGSTW